MAENQAKLQIEIDGKKVSAKPGEMVIQAADAAGVYIPRFCYHEKLSVAANCRMCLVEVENSRKPLPACATPVAEGMKVFTASKIAMDSQKAVMEFLLINHPLDCPICDQGGECELQDLSVGYGADASPFDQKKRAVTDPDLGPLISTEMTRCIHCTRCVRFGDEVAGMRELGAVGRGENMEITTYVKHFMASELSGNIIDLCPVGALTSKPYRFMGRSWEMKEHNSIAPHDGVGSNIYVHTRGFIETDYRQVMRVVPRTNENINEGWISDRDRFSYEAVNSRDRILKPRVRTKKGWKEVEWIDALNAVVKSFKSLNAKKIAGLASPSSTLEALTLFKKVLKGLGSSHIDHRVAQTDFRQMVSPGLPITFEELENQETIFLVGSNIRHEQPLLNHRVRKAVLKGASVVAVNPVDYPFNYDLNQKIVSGTESFVLDLAGVAKALGVKISSELGKLPTHKAYKEMAETLKANSKGVILLGVHALNHPDFLVIDQLARAISEKTGLKLGYLSEGANAKGACLADVLPVGKTGLDAKEMFLKPQDAYLLMDVEPEMDSAYSEKALKALEKAFVVVLSPFTSEKIESYADVILPTAPFTETSGTYVNLQGDWQSFKPVTRPMGMARPAWKVLRVLGNLLDLNAFNETTSEAVRDKLKSQCEKKPFEVEAISDTSELTLKSDNNVIYRVADRPMYACDILVRRAEALQKVPSERLAFVYMHPELAEEKGFKEGQMISVAQGGNKIKLPVKLDETLMKNNVFIPAGLPETAGFGEAFAAVELLGGKSS